MLMMCFIEIKRQKELYWFGKWTVSPNSDSGPKQLHKEEYEIIASQQYFL